MHFFYSRYVFMLTSDVFIYLMLYRNCDVIYVFLGPPLKLDDTSGNNGSVVGTKFRIVRDRWDFNCLLKVFSLNTFKKTSSLASLPVWNWLFWQLAEALQTEADEQQRKLQGA